MGRTVDWPRARHEWFSQLLALAAEVAVLIKNESHYALRDSTADTNCSRVKEEENVCWLLGLFCSHAMPLAHSLVSRIKIASDHSASLYSRTLMVTRGCVDLNPQGLGRKR